MLFEDSYKIVINQTQSAFNSRGSKFFGFVFPVNHKEEIKSHLENIKKQFPDASHACYAYILHPDKSDQRSNDDGEPSNSAGRPILRQILALDLTNVLVVVVRYFGGKLLGIPGLIEAYGETARLALEQAQIQDKIVEAYYQIDFDYENEAEVWRLIKETSSRVEEQNYDEQGCLIVAIKRNSSSDFEKTASQYFKLKVKFVRVG